MQDFRVDEINITLVPPKNDMVAFCSFVVNGAFFVGNVAIHKKFCGGYRLVYPICLLKSGIKSASFKPLSAATGAKIESAVIDELHRVFERVMKNRRERNDERAGTENSEFEK